MEQKECIELDERPTCIAESHIQLHHTTELQIEQATTLQQSVQAQNKLDMSKQIGPARKVSQLHYPKQST